MTVHAGERSLLFAIWLLPLNKAKSPNRAAKNKLLVCGQACTSTSYLKSRVLGLDEHTNRAVQQWHNKMHAKFKAHLLSRHNFQWKNVHTCMTCMSESNFKLEHMSPGTDKQIPVWDIVVLGVRSRPGNNESIVYQSCCCWGEFDMAQSNLCNSLSEAGEL